MADHTSTRIALLLLIPLLGLLPLAAAADTLTYDFESPAALPLSGLPAATFTVGGVPLQIWAGTLDQDGNFLPGGAAATLFVRPPGVLRGGLGVDSDINAGTGIEETFGLTREEGLLFVFHPAVDPTTLTLVELTYGETIGASEAVRIFADGSHLADVLGDGPIGVVVISLPPGIGSLAFTPLADLDVGLSSDPSFFLASIEVERAAIEATVDVRPGSCTNPLNTRSKGVLPAAILGSMELDVAEIDPASVRLAGVTPRRTSLADVAAPFEGNPNDCTPTGPDGWLDLVFQVESPALLAAIEAAMGPLSDGQVVLLPLEASLFDGTPVVGEGAIVAHVKGPAGTS